jgi:hypothetical protein
MNVEADPEENAFELDGLVIKPKATSGKATRGATPRASRPKNELFARITEWHDVRLIKVKSRTTIILFHYLIRHSIKVFNHPFELPVDYLAKEIGLNRRRQLRAVRDLVRVGIVKIERENFHSLPIISIPRTTKTRHKTT